jgi:hypothetical protein
MKQQLAIIDDENKHPMSMKHSLKIDGIYNPIIELDISKYKKHNSLAPLKLEKDESMKAYRRVNSQEMELTKLKRMETKKDPTGKNDNLALSISVKKPVDDEKKKTNIRWKKKLGDFLDSMWVIIIMTTFTLFALFANDIQAAWCPATVDFPFDVIQCILLCLFTIEIILNCVAKDGYIWSFFFWLDIIATLSLIQDINFIFQPMLNAGSTSQTGSAGKNAQAAGAVSKVSSASRYII